MSSQVIYAMHGFNVPKVDSSYQRIVKLKNNFEYHFKNHSSLLLSGKLWICFADLK